MGLKLLLRRLKSAQLLVGVMQARTFAYIYDPSRKKLWLESSINACGMNEQCFLAKYTRNKRFLSRTRTKSRTHAELHVF